MATGKPRTSFTPPPPRPTPAGGPGGPVRAHRPYGANSVSATSARSSRSLFNRPLLSTIDKYVLSSFLKNYLISLFVLIGLYVVLDMVFNFDEFVQVNASDAAEESGSILQTLSMIGNYYFFQSFRIFNYLAGVIPVVATAFTLMRMSRFNELAALLAAGVQLIRVAAPILIASVFISGMLLFVNQELIVPNLIGQLTRERGESASLMENRVLRAMPDGEHSLLFAGRYTPPLDGAIATMEVIDVFTRVGGKTTQLTADKATFDPATNTWQLVNGIRSEISEMGGPRGASAREVTYDGGGVNPETIALFISRGDFVDLLSYRRIDELLAQKTTVGRIDLMRVRDARLAGYIMNLFLVALTVPCVLTREPMQLRTAAGRVFLLVGLAMATIFVTQNMAGQPPENAALASRWPALMAWLPVFIFGPVAVLLLDRLKS